MKLSPVGEKQIELAIVISKLLAKEGVEDIMCMPVAINIMVICQKFIDSNEPKRKVKK